MKRIGSLFTAVFLLAGLLCAALAAKNYWAHFRMRTVPMEVVSSALTIDAGARDPDYPAEFVFTLHLQLRSTDGAARTIQWDTPPGHAAYPEEAFDELAHWAPGTRHTVRQLRGDSQTLRPENDAFSPERTAGNGFVFGALLCAVGAAISIAVLGATDPWLARLRLSRFLGLPTVFLCIGAALLLLAAGFVSSRVPRILNGPNASATIQPAPPSYPPEALPPNVTVTPAGRKLLDSASWRQVRLLTFSWNGHTLRGGAGLEIGAYDRLSAACPPGASTCQFQIDPRDRWDVDPPSRWNAAFFAPLGLLLLFGLALGRAGLHLRRNPA